jgi:hypothetical protein
LSTATALQAPAVYVKPGFTLADRLHIQQQHIRDRDYIIVGRLTSVVFEGQRKITGLSQSRPRWHNSQQSKHVPDSMAPFSEKQTVLWSSITLDWLSHKNAPLLAISRDRQDLLLPHGMTPLPDIPDPRWVPKHAEDTVKKIPQLLTGCPVVGDRVRDKIIDRDGRVYGVIHPVLELCVMLGGVTFGFGRIRGCMDPTDNTYLTLMIDDSNPQQLKGYFVGGRFQFGN